MWRSDKMRSMMKQRLSDWFTSNCSNLQYRNRFKCLEIIISLIFSVLLQFSSNLLRNVLLLNPSRNLLRF